MKSPMEDLLDTAEKIRSMEIRGAALIGRAAARALKEFALSIEPSDLAEFNAEVGQAADILLNTRPTAVSLANAIRMVMRRRGTTWNQPGDPWPKTPTTSSNGRFWPWRGSERSEADGSGTGM